MRIVYICHNLPPEPGATKRPLKQAKILADCGHQVTIVTAFPSYPYGRIYPAYRGRVFMRETIDGVSIARVWALPTFNQGFVRRCISYFSFFLAAIVASFTVGRPDVVISCTTPPLSELAGLIVARLRAAYLVLEVRDLLPERLTETKTLGEGRISRGLRRYYDYVLDKADILTLAEVGMSRALRQRGVSRPEFLELPHGVDFDEIDAPSIRSARADLKMEDKFVAMYAGSFSAYYHVPELLRAAKILRDECPSAIIVLIGAGAEFPVVEFQVKSGNVPNVLLLPGVAPDSMWEYLRAADVFIHPQVLPHVLDGTKIKEYLAIGCPVVNVCYAPDAAGQIEALDFGRSVAPFDPEALVTAIKYYFEDRSELFRVGEKSRAMARSNFNRRSIVSKLDARIRSLARD